HLPALAFERPARREDLVGEPARRVVLRRGEARAQDGMAAVGAELVLWRERRTALRTVNAEARATRHTEGGRRAIGPFAAGTAQGATLQRGWEDDNDRTGLARPWRGRVASIRERARLERVARHRHGGVSPLGGRDRACPPLPLRS